MRRLAGMTALVTGASSGIGEQIARQLATAGAHLVLTARRADRLAALATELGTAHGIDATTIACDLAAPGAAERLFAAATAARPIDVLINNAGFATLDGYLAVPWERHQQMLALNAMAAAELCYRFGTAMRARGTPAYILNVASVVALLPSPGFTAYAASKAFLHSLSQGLAAELAGSNVSVTSLCPGGTTTEFSAAAGQVLNRAHRAGMMSAERVARIGLRAMVRRRRVAIPGFSNQLMALVIRVVPTRLASATSRLVTGRSSGQHALPGERSP